MRRLKKNFTALRWKINWKKVVNCSRLNCNFQFLWTFVLRKNQILSLNWCSTEDFLRKVNWICPKITFFSVISSNILDRWPYLTLFSPRLCSKINERPQKSVGVGEANEATKKIKTINLEPIHRNLLTSSVKSRKSLILVLRFASLIKIFLISV